MLEYAIREMVQQVLLKQFKRLPAPVSNDVPACLQVTTLSHFIQHPLWMQYLQYQGALTWSLECDRSLGRGKNDSDEDPTRHSEAYHNYRTILEACLEDNIPYMPSELMVSNEIISSFRVRHANGAYPCRYRGCSWSSANFNTAKARDLHEGLHLQEFACKHDNCGLQMSSRRALRNHQRKYHTTAHDLKLPPFMPKQRNAPRVARLMDLKTTQQSVPTPEAHSPPLTPFPSLNMGAASHWLDRSLIRPEQVSRLPHIRSSEKFHLEAQIRSHWKDLDAWSTGDPQYRQAYGRLQETSRSLMDGLKAFRANKLRTASQQQQTAHSQSQFEGYAQLDPEAHGRPRSNALQTMGRPSNGKSFASPQRDTPEREVPAVASSSQASMVNMDPADGRPRFQLPAALLAQYPALQNIDWSQVPDPVEDDDAEHALNGAGTSSNHNCSELPPKDRQPLKAKINATEGVGGFQLPSALLAQYPALRGIDWSQVPSSADNSDVDPKYWNDSSPLFPATYGDMDPNLINDFRLFSGTSDSYDFDLFDHGHGVSAIRPWHLTDTDEMWTTPDYAKQTFCRSDKYLTRS